MKVKWLLPLFIATIITVILSISACSTPKTSPTDSNNSSFNTIKIGALLPLAGPNAAEGKIFRNAMELALDTDNWQVDNKKIKLVIEDEGGLDPSLALEKAKKLVQSDKVDLILGPYNIPSALTVLPYTSSLPMINLKWSLPVANKSELANKYAFWVTPMRQDVSYPLGLYVYRDGLKSASILGTNEPVVLDFTEGFKNAFKSQGGKIIQEQWISPDETDFTPYLSNPIPAKSFICSVLGDKAKTIFLKQFAALKLYDRFPVFLAETGTLAPDTMQALGDDIIGITGVEGYLPDNDSPANTRFLEEYRQTYNEEPPKSSVNAYNCMRIAIEALKSTGGNTSPDLLKSALLDLRLDLPTGPFSFSPGRIGIHTISIREVVKEDNKLEWKTIQRYLLVETHQQTYP